MSKRKAIGVFLVFFVSILLTTCELQLNKASNSLTLRILIPGSASGGARNTPTTATNAKSLAGGASVQVTILTLAGAPWQSSESIPIGGKTSVDYTFVLPPPGTYQVSASLFDGSGNLLAQASTSFTVPTQTSPVVLTIVPTSTILVSSIIVTSAGGVTSMSYSSTLQMSAAILPANAANQAVTWSLLDAVTGSAATGGTISSSGLLTADAPNGETVKVIATAQDGSGVSGYMEITISGS